MSAPTLSTPISDSIRPATVSDIAEMVRIINAAYVVEAFCLHGLRTNKADIQAQMQTGQFFVCQDPRLPAALRGSVLCSVSKERAYMGMLAVDPAYQGQGIANMLIDFVARQARSAGCRWLDLSVVNLRTELLDFYARFGFVAFATEDFPVPEKIILPLHLVQMRKML